MQSNSLSVSQTHTETDFITAAITQEELLLKQQQNKNKNKMKKPVDSLPLGCTWVFQRDNDPEHLNMFKTFWSIPRVLEWVSQISDDNRIDNQRRKLMVHVCATQWMSCNNFSFWPWHIFIYFLFQLNTYVKYLYSKWNGDLSLLFWNQINSKDFLAMAQFIIIFLYHITSLSFLLWLR